MSLRALVDVVIHLESFRNIDLFFQGIYYIRLKLYTKKRVRSIQTQDSKTAGTNKDGSTNRN